MTDNDLYDAVRIALVHTATAAVAAAVIRPDMQPMLERARQNLDAACSTAALAIPCLECDGEGCPTCEPLRRRELRRETLRLATAPMDQYKTKED